MYKEEILVPKSYNDYMELAREIFRLWLSSNDENYISIITKGWKEVTVLTEELIKLGMNISYIDIKSDIDTEDFDHDEYIICLSDSGLCVEPFYSIHNNAYLKDECVIAYISAESNSKVLKACDWDKYAIEFEINPYESDCNHDCDNCIYRDEYEEEFELNDFNYFDEIMQIFDDIINF